MIIYADELIVINLVLNYVILAITKRLLKSRSGRLRLLGGSSLGAVYALFMFLPGFGILYSFAGKVVFSALLVFLTFGTYKWRSFFKALGVFYLVSFAFGGAVYALLSLCGFYDMLLPIKILVAATVICYLLILSVSAIYKRMTVREAQIFDLTIKLGERSVILPCLLDTGNSLCEPISGTPVTVAELDKVRPLLPPELLTAVEQNTYHPSLHLIPFNALGTENGFIPAFRPDSSEFDQKPVICLIGIYNGTLAADGGYAALISPMALSPEPVKP